MSNFPLADTLFAIRKLFRTFFTTFKTSALCEGATVLGRPESDDQVENDDHNLSII
jgi:hypothetical protein